MYQLPELLTFPNLVHGFSTCDDGNMSFKWGDGKEVAQNRKRFLTEMKLMTDKGICTELIHSDKVIRVSKKDADHGILQPPTLKADGLITNEPGIFLMHVVADCISMLFFDPTHKAIGLAHVGRRGTDQKMAQKMVAEFSKSFSTEPDRLVVAMGPSIHSCCYSFSGPLKPTNGSAAEGRPFLTTKKDSTTYINLVGYNLFQLTEAGVEQENIFMSEHCTAHSDDFYSHYRDVRDKKPEARFMAIIGLN